MRVQTSVDMMSNDVGITNSPVNGLHQHLWNFLHNQCD